MRAPEEERELGEQGLRLQALCRQTILYAQNETSLLQQICKIFVQTGRYRSASAFRLEEGRWQPLAAYTGAVAVPFQGPPAGIETELNRAILEGEVQSAEWQDRSGFIVPLTSLERRDSVYLIESDTPIDTESYEFAVQCQFFRELGEEIGYGITILRERLLHLDLFRQNQLFAKALEQSPVACVITSAEGVIEYVNDRFTLLTGYPAVEARGETLRILKSGMEEETVYQELWKTIGQGKNYRGELINRKKGGELFTARINISSLRDTRGLITHYVMTMEDMTLEKYYEQQIDRFRYYDSLTGLPNRFLFFDRLEHAIQKAGNDRAKLYVVFVDIDNFTEISRVTGYETGDELLRRVAERIQWVLSPVHTLARFGNDEFMILIEKEENAGEISSLVSRILHSVKGSYGFGGSAVNVTASAGISVYPDNGSDSRELLQAAEMAQLRARSSAQDGGGEFAFFSEEMQNDARESMRFGTYLRRSVESIALGGTEFELHYQPVVELKTGRIVSAEALLRWNHRRLGSVSPEKFIAEAERNDLIYPLGGFALSGAVEQLARWQRNFEFAPGIAVNVSVKQFQDPAFGGQLRALLAGTGVSPSLLEFEITERVLMSDTDRTLSVLQLLRDMGIRLLLDDLGSGYSSLQYLLKFRFDVLKIDRSFVSSIGSDVGTQSREVSRSIIDLAHSLNCDVIAEGIETAEQLRYLIDQGCDYGQGFFLARPLPVDQFNKLLIAGKIELP